MQSEATETAKGEPKTTEKTKTSEVGTKQTATVSSGSEYPYLCPNCKKQFKTALSYGVHSSRNRPACAYQENEAVTDVTEFTPENVVKSWIEHVDLDLDTHR